MQVKFAEKCKVAFRDSLVQQVPEVSDMVHAKMRSVWELQEQAAKLKVCIQIGVV